jgi:hypothetical protein
MIRDFMLIIVSYLKECWSEPSLKNWASKFSDGVKIYSWLNQVLNQSKLLWICHTIEPQQICTYYYTITPYTFVLSFIATEVILGY